MEKRGQKEVKKYRLTEDGKDGGKHKKKKNRLEKYRKTCRFRWSLLKLET